MCWSIICSASQSARLTFCFSSSPGKAFDLRQIGQATHFRAVPCFSTNCRYICRTQPLQALWPQDWLMMGASSLSTSGENSAVRQHPHSMDFMLIYWKWRNCRFDWLLIVMLMRCVVACRRPSFDLSLLIFWILLDDFFQKLLNLPQTAHNMKLKTPIHVGLQFILFY